MERRWLTIHALYQWGITIIIYLPWLVYRIQSLVLSSSLAIQNDTQPWRSRLALPVALRRSCYWMATQLWIDRAFWHRISKIFVILLERVLHGRVLSLLSKFCEAAQSVDSFLVCVWNPRFKMWSLGVDTLTVESLRMKIQQLWIYHAWLLSAWPSNLPCIFNSVRKALHRH